VVGAAAVPFSGHQKAATATRRATAAAKAYNHFTDDDAPGAVDDEPHRFTGSTFFLVLFLPFGIFQSY
jgi:hypothetical protein